MWIQILSLVIVFVIVLITNRDMLKGLKQRGESSEGGWAAVREPGAVSQEELEAWSDFLNQNRLPSFVLDVAAERPTSNLCSFIGDPYPNNWQGLERPMDERGNPMQLLAQLNFAELSNHVVGLPSQGFLLFFISSDQYFGLDLTSSLDDRVIKSTGHRVVYMSSLPELKSDSFALEKQSSGHSPVTGFGKLVAKDVLQLPTTVDYRYNLLLHERSEFGEDYDDFLEEMNGLEDCHRVGGYSEFAQFDPRSVCENSDQWFCLLQLASVDHHHVQVNWGDSGFAHFFIKEEDLKKCEFSQVFYHWDSH